MAVEPRSRFLTLPRELRDEILSQLIYPSEGTILVTVLNPQRLVRASESLGLQVLRVNKQLKTEGSQTFQRILTQTPRFVLELELDQAMEFLSKLSEDNVRSIRSLWISEGLAHSIHKSVVLLDRRRGLFNNTTEPEEYDELSARLRRRVEIRVQLLNFFQDRMRLDSIYMSTNRRRRGWPTTDMLFSLAKFLHDGIVQKVCLFSEDDASCRDALPLSDSYNQSQRPIRNDPYSELTPTPLRWKSMIASSHSTLPLIMTQEGRHPIPFGLEPTILIHYGGVDGSKPFEYPKSCGCMYTYRKNPATITKT